MIELNNVAYTYAGAKAPVLDKVSARFEPQKLYALIGKSGSGKSTLLALMAGLDNPTEGSIMVDHKDLKDLDRDAYRAQKIGTLFQGPNLLMHLSALDNIILSLNISKSTIEDKHNYVKELLRRVDFDETCMHRKIAKLSKGEQQRIAIARALAHNPDIIIADEPIANLDEETADEIMAILETLAHTYQKTVIVVSHARMVSRYADELWRLNEGRLTFIR